MNTNPKLTARSLGTTADGTALAFAGRGRLVRAFLAVKATARWVKFYDKATAPAATDTPILSVYVPAADTRVVDFGIDGLDVVQGLGYRMAVNGIDNDATYTSFADNDSSITVQYQLGQ
jgi:hypothetical protein